MFPSMQLCWPDPWSSIDVLWHALNYPSLGWTSFSLSMISWPLSIPSASVKSVCRVLDCDTGEELWMLLWGGRLYALQTWWNANKLQSLEHVQIKFNTLNHWNYIDVNLYSLKSIHLKFSDSTTLMKITMVFLH